MTYYSNDAITIAGSFTNTDSVATDPTGLSLIVKPHGGTATTYTYPDQIIKDGTGEYHMTWTAPAVSHKTMYLVQWLPTGAVQRASSPDRIYVYPTLG